MLVSQNPKEVTMAKYIRGIDVAAWEPNINWERVRAQGIHFAFIKASQADFTDRLFDMHWAGAKRAGILRGAYHFLDPKVDGRVQAETFLSRIKLEPGDLPPVLDLEDLKAAATTSAPTTGKGSKGSKGAKNAKGSKGAKANPNAGMVPNSQFVACAQDWLSRVESATGRKPIIYSGPAFLQARMSGANGKPPLWSMKYTLWLANYLNHPINEDFDLPWQPNGWPPWMFWQYSDRGILDGVMNEDGFPTGVDLNFFRGTLEQLYALAGAPMPDGTVVDIPKVDVIPKVDEGEVVVVADKPVPPPLESETSFIRHLVKSGDTLFGIALRYGTSVDAIVAVNPQITNPNLIRDGDTLNIPRQ
jgi:GH25 family lysozyme M1 (1,4-beta-N-acetylmuramidase)